MLPKDVQHNGDIVDVAGNANGVVIHHDENFVILKVRKRTSIIREGWVSFTKDEGGHLAIRGGLYHSEEQAKVVMPHKDVPMPVFVRYDVGDL